MPWRQVVPAIDPKVRKLCFKRYPGHPRGCPNYGKKKSCPPAAPLLGVVLDLARPVFAVWNAFDFGAHTSRMRAVHPGWTPRQVACCLYWQGTARKALCDELVTHIREQWAVQCTGYTLRSLEGSSGLGWRVVTCPEACGVNVTETMRRIGIELEWPPRTVAYQVALVGSP